MASNQTDGASAKPTKYYVDFENVHGPGLKGIEDLRECDEVFVFYSQAAETFHIEHAINILSSKARVEFVEIDGGTRNSLDFQLVVALFGTMDDEHEYAIVSADGGFDAAIRMGERLELPPVRRITDLTGSTEAPPAKSSRSRRSRTKKADTQDKTEQPKQDEQDTQDVSQAQEKPGKQTKSNGQPSNQQVSSPNESEQASQPERSAASEDDGKAATSSARKTSTGRKRRRPSSVLSAESTPDPQAQDSPAAEAEDSDQASEEAATPARSGRYSKRKEVKALLAANGVAVNQQQLSTVMKALNGVKNKQGFYRAIIQLEKQERGLELYRQVRDYYESMVEILRG